MTDQAKLKERLKERAADRVAYRCHGRAKAYNMPLTGWNPSSEGGTRWVENLRPAGLRVVSYADEVERAHISHTGWYADTFQESTYRGIVLQLPARGGRPVYLAGYEELSNVGSYRVDTSRLFYGPKGGEDQGQSEELRDAARAADKFAEREAEDAREYDEAFQLGGQWSRLKEQAKEARKLALALFADLRKARAMVQPGDLPTLCSTLRAKVLHLREQIESWREEREKILDDNIFRGPHKSAFNEGAGEEVLS